MSEIGVNKAILIGRTGADTDVKYTAGGKAVANFSLAINESFKKKRRRIKGPRAVGALRRVGKAG